MAEFKLPDLGEKIEEAEILKVLVSEGDSVEVDQTVLELETDKATFELPSTVSGRVRKIHVSQGDRLRLGQTILTVDDDGGEGGDEDEDPRHAKAPQEEPPKQAKKPSAEPEREEAEPERGEETEEERPRDEPRGAKAPKRREEAREIAAGPAARLLARELGVDLAQVEGSASGGRATVEDVKAAARHQQGSEGAEPGEGGGPSPSDLERFGPIERRRLSGVERAAAHHLASSWRAIPHVTQHDAADVTELERMRRRFETDRRPSDPKLSPTALVVKAAVAALKAFPRLNASLDLAREELLLKRYYHVGVAVDTDYGLVVPVVRDADEKTIRQIAAEIAGLADRARARKLTRAEMEGASFSVTNLGGIGGTGFTPIVSHPEVAILGVSRLREEPRLHEGDLVVRLVMPLSLSYDHRAINGADAARFVRYLASLLEDPLRLLVES